MRSENFNPVSRSFDTASHFLSENSLNHKDILLKVKGARQAGEGLKMSALFAKLFGRLSFAATHKQPP